MADTRYLSVRTLVMLSVVLVATGCRHNVSLTRAAFKAIQSDNLRARVQAQLDSNAMNLLVVSSGFTWSPKVDGAAKFSALRSQMDMDTSKPTIVVGLGSSAYLAVAAFLWNDKVTVTQLEEAFERQRSLRKCVGDCRTSAGISVAAEVVRAISGQAKEGRILLLEFVNPGDRATYVVDVTRIVSNEPSPQREETINQLLHSAQIVKVERQQDQVGRVNILSAAVATDEFYRIMITLERVSDHNLRVRLVNVTGRCGIMSCPSEQRAHRALDISLQELLQTSIEKIAISTDQNNWKH
jgi:hypothetical protein